MRESTKLAFNPSDDRIPDSVREKMRGTHRVLGQNYSE